MKGLELENQLATASVSPTWLVVRRRADVNNEG